MPAKKTVGQKAASNYQKGVGTTKKGKLAFEAAVGAQDASRPERMKATRRAVRTAVKAGIRSKHPELKASKVRGRAAKQTRKLL